MSDQVMTTSTPPGWYPDPWRQATWRWWDGVAWTAFTDQGPNADWAEARPLRAGGIATLGFLVGLGVSTLVGVVLLLMGYETTDPAFLLGSTLGLWFGIGGSCVVAVKYKGSGSLRDLRLLPPRWVDAAMGLGFGIVGVIGVSIVAAVIQAIDKGLIPTDRSDIAEPIHSGDALAIFVIYAIAVVGAPFFEELYFRGLVQSTLTARWGFVVGIGVQALLFGIVHLDPENGWGNVGVFVMITLVGTMLGTIRHYTKRLAPGMFTHATYNAIIVTVSLLAK